MHCLSIFYGSKKDAQWLCGLLGKKSTELYLNKDFDPSPNTAMVYIERPDGRVLRMDFLRAVVGLSHEEIVKFAVPISVSGVRMNVLHPLFCLESRLANLDKLPTKRNTNGVLQARWVIDIVEAYLLKMRTAGASDREMIKACHQVAESAEYRSGPYCFHNHGVDPLQAVSSRVLKSVGGRFVQDDWPRRVERIQRKRDRKLVSYRVDLPTAQVVVPPFQPGLPRLRPTEPPPKQMVGEAPSAPDLGLAGGASGAPSSS